MSSFSVARNPQMIFYPSMVVNFQLRLDEGADAPMAMAAEDLAGGNSVATPASTGNQPAVLEAGTDDLSQIIGIVPRSCGVELPGYRQAGTFNLEIAFRDLPLDPRVIRALGVAIHLDTVTPSNFADGMTDQNLFGDSQFDSSKRRASIIETVPENLLLAGLVDNIVTEHADGMSIVRLEGRDLRGILLDTPISSKTLQSVKLDRPINEVVSHIVNSLHPSGSGIKVQVDASEWPSGIPNPQTVDDVTRINLDAAGESIKATAKGEAGEVNFWDLITNLCFLVGGVPHFVGSVLRIRPARTLFDARRQEEVFLAGDSTPFRNGLPRNLRAPQVRGEEQIAFRRITYGRDIRRLSFERKLGGVKVPVVEAVSYDTSGKTRGKDRLLKVQFPETPKARATSTGASGKTPQTDIIRIKVPGVKNKKRLLEIAKDVYQEIGRQEIGGAIETKNLTSFGGDNQDPDLVRLRPGDPVEIRVDASGLSAFPPPIAPLTDIEGQSFEQQVKEVTARLGDARLARALVSANRGETAGLTKTFRTATVRYDWADVGLGIAFDFQNFVEARYDVDS